MFNYLQNNCLPAIQLFKAYSLLSNLAVNGMTRQVMRKMDADSGHNSPLVLLYFTEMQFPTMPEDAQVEALQCLATKKLPSGKVNLSKYYCL